MKICKNINKKPLTALKPRKSFKLKYCQNWIKITFRGGCNILTCGCHLIVQVLWAWKELVFPKIWSQGKIGRKENLNLWKSNLVLHNKKNKKLVVSMWDLWHNLLNVLMSMLFQNLPWFAQFFYGYWDLQVY